ncbi:hypothetical protein A28LD_0616 [Idiomarina sp. A28L]|uniref:hypothetical protein n=1 Tax=Idiomarina sp. A28L TaxID=1036674 RepID=UPI0002138E2D|nr:hypothetical protein [Idiomarina sp. A28L]EGN75873.1 hypothetical protein A28LD_0616 [Idiomarina sp. A28L]
MKYQSVKLSDINFVDLPSTVHITRCSKACAAQLVQSFDMGDIQALLNSNTAIKVGKRIYACEFFFLLHALQQLMPELELNFILQHDNNIERATARIARYVALSSATSFAAIEASSFEAAVGQSLSYQTLFTRTQWHKIIGGNRSSLNYHDDKFKPQVYQSTFTTISLDETLAQVPSATGTSDE